MTEPEIIQHGKTTVAMVFRNDLDVTGVRFFTAENNPFQIGIHNRPSGTDLSPHIHVIGKPIKIDTIQEILFVQSGKIKVTLMTRKGIEITSVILIGGDSILLMNEGHGVTFLEDSRIFEVKQGPYPGTTHAKIYLNKAI